MPASTNSYNTGITVASGDASHYSWTTGGHNGGGIDTIDCSNQTLLSLIGVKP